MFGHKFAILSKFFSNPFELMEREVLTIHETTCFCFRE